MRLFAEDPQELEARGLALSGRLHELGIVVTERFWQSRTAMLCCDLDGVVFCANGVARQLLEPKEVLGRLATDVLHGAELEELLAHLRDGRHSGGELEVTVGERHLRSTWTVLHDEGRPWYLTVALVDVTETVTREQQARAEAEHWEWFARGAFEVAYLADADFRVLSITPGVEGEFGWTTEDVEGRLGYDFLHPDDHALMADALAAALAEPGRTVSVECRAATPDAGWAWVAERLTAQGRHVIGHVTRIDERRRAQEALAASEARHRARFEQSDVPQVEFDTDGTVVAVNDALCRLLGLHPEDLLGRPVTAFRAQDSVVNGVDIGALLSGEVRSAQYERLLVHSSGRRVPVAVNTTALLGPTGEVIGASSFVLDLSEVRDATTRLRRQEAFFAALSQRASDAGFVSTEQGELVFASQALARMLGYDEHPTDVDRLLDLVHPDDQQLAAEHFVRTLAGEDLGPVRVRIASATEGYRWLELVLADERHGDVGGIVANVRDVTAQVQADAALRASDARHRAIADTAQEGIWVVPHDGLPTYANQTLARILGVRLRELLMSRPDVLLGTEAAALLEQATPARHDFRYAHPDGRERTLQLVCTPMSADDGADLGNLVMVSDVTAQRALERDLRYAVLHDGLTGLPNRALLQNRLVHAVTREDEAGSAGTAVVMLDLDHFKLLNESRGHSIGDRVLVAVADRLRAAMRPQDTLARFGGDEFVVLCEGADAAAAAAVAAAVQAKLADPLGIDGHRIWVSASIGIATSAALTSGGDLLRFADAALHAAKRAGRGTSAFYDAALGEHLERRFELAGQLREALLSDGLRLHYQPLVSLATGEAVGLEALLRWTHPELGEVSPADFVPTAEYYGLSPVLDRWVFARAVNDLAQLRRQAIVGPTVYLSVNLSRHNLADRELPAELLAHVRRVGLDPDDIMIEITESALVGDVEQELAVAQSLLQLGFHVALDDFGTGYSSLAQLRTMPVTHVKMDASFLRGIDEDEDARAVVRAVADLARAVRLTVVAEGVETVEHAELLRGMGFDIGQGWLWSRAVPPEELAAVVSAHR